MKLQSAERRLIVAVVCVVAVLGIGVGIFKIYEKYERGRLEEVDAVERKAYNQTYSIGDELVLDSAVDDVVLSSGRPYEAAFPWSGRMDVAVDRVRVYPTADVLLADLDQNAKWVQYFELDHLNWARDIGLAERYVLLDVTIDNISAVPEDVSQTGHPWFNIGFINLSAQQNDMELQAFSGVPGDGDMELDGYRFDLPIGQGASYQLVYSVSSEADLDELFCYMGSVYAPDKYRVELGGMEIMPEGA